MSEGKDIDVQMWSLSQLRPYWRNPRDNQEAVGPVKESIEEFGFNQPLVVDPDGTIIVGHTRFQALSELGWSEAPVVVKDMDGEKMKAYRIADNKTAEFSGWNEDALLAELRELDEGMMQPYFEENVDALIGNDVGDTYEPPTQGEVEREQEKHDDTHKDRTEAAASDQVEVVCPHCAGEFYVSAADVKRRADRG